jgi:hypothetical protein
MSSPWIAQLPPFISDELPLHPRQNRQRTLNLCPSRIPSVKRGMCAASGTFLAEYHVASFLTKHDARPRARKTKAENPQKNRSTFRSSLPTQATEQQTRSSFRLGKGFPRRLLLRRIIEMLQRDRQPRL